MPHFNPTYQHTIQKNTSSQDYQIPYLNGHKKSRNMPNSTQVIKDYGPYPFVVNIEKVTKANDTFRTVLWTGDSLQLTLMSIPPGESIGLEIHNDVDQFLRIEDGTGLVMMGDQPNQLNFQQTVSASDAFVVPAGTWHNLLNIGSTPLKLYSIYAPPHHPFGTVHQTKADAEAAENPNK
ncbi:cupin domain-containing protein [Cellulosilyticum sp. ST5]|uniref:Cupin 2 conserved barrel domain protein n=1 Tax=Cellulosilyticum lentocellum (strain ATCC 49066 / DSM 5427 / NCIMB 11756 / RHM5) TaxID=642492 RepID=F2JNG1_CELLD|nr:cupin domain-containing protein [Cellulosilyticum lentocellum]ADZ84737.1 Cupin 2 conserved barrel domain protein [Cellulosilyticum lentocellum DSM 5427]